METGFTMLFDAVQATNGILIEINTPFWDWLIPVMYAVSALLAVGAFFALMDWDIEGISINWFIAALSLAIIGFVGTGITHSHLEKNSNYDYMSERILEEYGVEIAPQELEDLQLNSFIREGTVKEIPLPGVKKPQITRNSDTGYFEQGKSNQYSIIVDGRVIELVQVQETEDGESVFIPLENLSNK